MNHLKVRSQPTKVVIQATEALPVVLEAMQIVSEIVGSTLGPGGRPVLIEKQEYGLPPFLTKDGVTVYKSLGFENAAMDLVMEAIRDPAIHTANEAGDGTTTATILAASIVRKVHEWHQKHPDQSPQAICRTLQAMIEDGLRFLQERSVAATMRLPDGSLDPEGNKLLLAVAKTSANGDEDIAEASLRASQMAGDGGNVLLTEAPGSGYKVEKVEGYSLPVGWEDTAKSLAANWFTDQAREVCRVENPRIIVYHGKLSGMTSLTPILEKVIAQYEANQGDDVALILGYGAESGVIASTCKEKDCKKALALMEVTGKGVVWGCKSHPQQAEPIEPLLDECRRLGKTVIVAASSFSDLVLTSFFMNFRREDSPQLVPCLIPQGPSSNYQLQVMHDIAAVVGATVIDPVSAREAKLSCLGPGVSAFEMDRLRSSFEGAAHKSATLRSDPYRQQLAARIDAVSKQVQRAASSLDRTYSQERLAKLTGGLIRLTVCGVSNADIRERRDRVEDAICAIRGATREGCLPGGCWGLFVMARYISEQYEAEVSSVLVEALREPFRRLLLNAGCSKAEAIRIREEMIDKVEALSESASSAGWRDAKPEIFDAITKTWIDPFEAGILDSTPAVDRAVRSAAAQMPVGYLGGIIAFKRDDELERKEALAATAHQRAVAQGANEANERG